MISSRKIAPLLLQQIRARAQKPPKKTKAKQPTWFFPHSQEREYMRDLFKLTNRLKAMIKEYLLPEVPGMIKEVGVYTPDRQDDYMTTLKRIIAFIAERIRPYTNEAIITAAHEGQEINEYNKKQFLKVTKSSFGINIFQDEPWLADQLRLFANQNAQLINSIPEDELERVAGIVERGLQQGERFETVAREIQKSFGITHRRAKLIARDQTSKLNSSLTKLRQQELGVEEYIWETSMDERVRPSHKANQGKRFRWDSPPAKTGHPGHDVNCRCVAEPVLEGLLDIKMGHP